MSIKLIFNKVASRTVALTFLLVLFMSAQIHAQGKTSVSGTVLDEMGPLPGVNIVEKGTANSVVTDFDGKFTIKVTGPKSELVFSFIGFETQTQVVGSKTSLNVILKGAANKLDEVVVIGYGTSKKSDLTGSVSVVSGDDLKKLSMASVAETLTGRVAGVQVTSSEGAPDSEIKIRIRGGGSLTQDSTPLLIVDGFPVNSISDISPNDIANISILKDASSTAIYGARGANGVIIITTKSGKDGKIAVTYNTFFGLKTIANTIDVLSPQDYVKWQYEYASRANDLPSFEDYFGTYADIGQYNGLKGTNYQKEIYGRTGKVQSHDLGIRGGSDKLSYNFNYSRYDEEAIMIGSDFRRNNLSLNLKNKASDKIDLAFTMRYSDTKVTGGGANDQNEISSQDARLRHSVGYAPIPIPGLTTDNTDEAISGYLVNPFVAVADNQRLQLRKNYNMLGSFSWKLAENLKFKSDIGLDNYSYRDYRFYGRSTYYVNNVPLAENQGAPALVINDRRDVKFRSANTLNFDFKDLIPDNHKLTVLVGQELLKTQSETETSAIHGFPKLFTFSNSMNLSGLGKPQSVSTFVNPEDKLLSFFGRVNYDLNNKYLLTATYRADGSSKFLGDNQWGFFPSAAVAWKIKEESFLKEVAWLNELKLRLSYGQAGNNNIPTGQTAQIFTPANSAWINNVSTYLAPLNVMPNPNLKWETTVTQNLGLDFSMFKGRVTGSVEVYKNLTKDLLLKFETTGSPYAYQYRNLGEIENKGLEASLNVVAIDKPDYGLNFSFNIGMNKNRINSLGGTSNFGAATNWASTAINNDFVVNLGGSVGEMFGYVSDGRYEVADFDYVGGVYTLKAGVANNSAVIGDVAPGAMKLKDLNGDGVVNLEDRRVIGNANPTSTGGFVINANAYGFDLSAAFNWSYGNDIYNANKIEFTTAVSNNGIGQYRNLSTVMADGNRWTSLDPTTGLLVTDPTALAALNANTSMWSPYQSRYVLSDWAIEDGSFLRLNTLTLGYTLPNEFNKRMGISKFRLYATCNNVFILTSYSGLDPEVSTRRNTPLTPGVDYSPFPRSRQYVFGLNLNF